MDKVITYPMGNDFIAGAADYIYRNLRCDNNDFSRTAVVFGGKRPSLFLKKALADRIGGSFFPPQFFSINEFIYYLTEKRGSRIRITDLDACYAVYQLARTGVPGILGKRKSFSDFLPWAREIVSFIDELDIEDVAEGELKKVQASAEIGYEIPESINNLLRDIVAVRAAYHEKLRKENRYSKGLIYRDTMRNIAGINLDEFDRVLFCGLFYLHRTEEIIIKHLYDSGKAVLFFQGNSRDWPVLDQLGKRLGCRIESKQAQRGSGNISIYKGFDTHSQVGLAREILKKIPPTEKSVIVLPDPETLIPLLSEITSITGDINVSMGYPLKRSSLYGLIKAIFKAQLSRKQQGYYARDYLKVLLHPLIKNLNIFKDRAVTRVLAHKIEEALLGAGETVLGGSIFTMLEDIAKTPQIYQSAGKTLSRMGINVSREDIRDIFISIHNWAFRMWEDIGDFNSFCLQLGRFLGVLVNKSPAAEFPLNLKIMERIYLLKDELERAEFGKEYFASEDIFRIFDNMLSREIVSFSGSPLRGLQILGLLETRALRFANAIIIDANESRIPRFRLYEPLIPRQVMAELGLFRYRHEEEIQKYNFMNLIASVGNSHIIYDNSPEKERSRFVEELIWKEQKEKESLEVMPLPLARFPVAILSKKGRIGKSAPVRSVLEDFVFSPSSIDTYLCCPLRFYYQYIMRLEKKGELLDEPAAADIGTFIHHILDRGFREYEGKMPVIDKGFRQRFMKFFDSSFAKDLKRKIGGESFLVKEIMEYRLNRFLDHEAQRKVKKLIALEDDSAGGTIDISGREVGFRCRIDRIDMLPDGNILILDYKTGSSASVPAGLASLLAMEQDRQSIKSRIHSFQLPLYYYFARRKYKDAVSNAALYNLRKLKLSYFINQDKMDTAGEVMDICMKALGTIIDEIFDPAREFEGDESNSRICGYCPFTCLCR